MIEVLVTGSIIYTGEEVIRDGYVYIKGARIVEVGSGTPPSDLTYAHLILGGAGRIVAPSLTAIVDAPAYPWRLLLRGLRDRAGLYERLPLREAVIASLPAVYEAHIYGIGRLVVEYRSEDLARELERVVGGYYHTAIPACLPGRPESGVRVADSTCSGEAEVEYEEGSAAAGSLGVLALAARPVYSPGPGAHEASESLRRLLGLPPNSIREGGIAEIAVYNAARPPGMLLDKAPEAILKEIHGYGLTVESLLVGDSILVDQGEHLYIGEKQFKEARRLAGR